MFPCFLDMLVLQPKTTLSFKKANAFSQCKTIVYIIARSRYYVRGLGDAFFSVCKGKQGNILKVIALQYNNCLAYDLKQIRDMTPKMENLWALPFINASCLRKYSYLFEAMLPRRTILLQINIGLFKYALVIEQMPKDDVFQF